MRLLHAAGLGSLGAGVIFFVAANWQAWGLAGRFGLLQAGYEVLVPWALIRKDPAQRPGKAPQIGLGVAIYDDDGNGIKGALDSPQIRGLPVFAITGLRSLGTTGPGTIPIAATGSGNFPSRKSGKIWQLLDNFSWVRDRHTIKFGADLQRVTMFVYATNAARPTFNFNGTYTGSGLGDFLLGYINSTATSELQTDTIQQHVYNGYLQDDWKATNTLTLNFGLRYELPTPFVEEHDRESNFVLDSGPCYDAGAGGSLCAGGTFKCLIPHLEPSPSSSRI